MSTLELVKQKRALVELENQLTSIAALKEKYSSIPEFGQIESSLMAAYNKVKHFQENESN